MRGSIINSIKFQLCAALGSDAAGITEWTKNVARFGFKKVLPVTDHDFYYMYVNYFTENQKKKK